MYNYWDMILAEIVNYRRDKSYLAGIMRSSILGAAVLGTAALPAYAASDITIGGSATLTTDYVFRGLMQTAGNPSIQGEFNLTYSVKHWPDLFHFTIWSSNLDFGGGPQGQEIAPIEIDGCRHQADVGQVDLRYRLALLQLSRILQFRVHPCRLEPRI